MEVQKTSIKGSDTEEVKCLHPQETTEEKLKQYLSLYKTNPGLGKRMIKNH